MNQTQALAKARKILGPKAMIQIRKSIPIGEERDAEIARRKVLTGELKVLTEARDARRSEVLKADAEYQRLKNEAARIEKERDNLHAGWHRRVSVGVDAGIGFYVKAEGDNLDEALADLEAKTK